MPRRRSSLAAGSLAHGPEGCRIAGHLTVRKVPGTLKLVLHSNEHDHEDHLVNSTHAVSEFWFGEPLSRLQQSRLSAADRKLSDDRKRWRITNLDGAALAAASQQHKSKAAQPHYTTGAARKV